MQRLKAPRQTQTFPVCPLPSMATFVHAGVSESQGLSGTLAMASRAPEQGAGARMVACAACRRFTNNAAVHNPSPQDHARNRAGAVLGALFASSRRNPSGSCLRGTALMERNNVGRAGPPCGSPIDDGQQLSGELDRDDHVCSGLTAACQVSRCDDDLSGVLPGALSPGVPRKELQIPSAFALATGLPTPAASTRSLPIFCQRSAFPPSNELPFCSLLRQWVVGDAPRLRTAGAVQPSWPSSSARRAACANTDPRTCPRRLNRERRKRFRLQPVAIPGAPSIRMTNDDDLHLHLSLRPDHRRLQRNWPRPRARLQRSGRGGASLRPRS
jgi:hypothetical protein